MLQLRAGVIAIGAAGVFVYASMAAAQTLTIGTGAPTSIFQRFGEMICQPAAAIDGLDCGTRNVGSWDDSLTGMADGANNLALLLSDRVAEMAERGDEFLAATDARAVLALPARSVTVLVRADSDIRSMAEVSGRTTRTAWRQQVWPFLQWLREAAWDADDLKGFGELGYENSVNALCDGDSDVTIFMDGHPGQLTRIATDRCPLRLIPIDDDAVTRVLTSFPDLVRVQVPAETYAGQTDSVATFGTYLVLAARGDVESDAVYKLVKALYEAYPAASEGIAPLAAWPREKLLPERFPLPVHPGAERFANELAGR